MVIAQGLSDHGQPVPMVTMSISGHTIRLDILCMFYRTYTGIAHNTYLNKSEHKQGMVFASIL